MTSDPITLTPLTSERQHDGVRGPEPRVPQQAGSPPPLARPPLRWPTAAITAVKARRALTEQLRGFATSPDWLPVGLDEGLDELREQHLELIERARHDLEAFEGAVIHAAVEDQHYAAALRDAMRAGKAPPKDNRTDPSTREREQAALIERVEAHCEVLAESVTRALDYIAENEDALLGVLHGARGDAEARCAEARQVLDEANSELWRLAMTGQWLQRQVDRHPVFGMGPAPVSTERPPKMFSDQLLQQSLNRAWHNPRRVVEPPQEEEQELLEPGDDEENVLLEGDA